MLAATNLFVYINVCSHIRMVCLVSYMLSRTLTRLFSAQRVLLCVFTCHTEKALQIVLLKCNLLITIVMVTYRKISAHCVNAMEILKNLQYFSPKERLFWVKKRNGQMERISFTDENNSYSSFGMTRALVLLYRIEGDNEIYAIVGVINQRRTVLRAFLRILFASAFANILIEAFVLFQLCYCEYLNIWAWSISTSVREIFTIN